MDAEPARREVPFGHVFSLALRGEPCYVIGLHHDPSALPVHEWTRDADADDYSLISQCVGMTLDVGCGPGRLTEALMRTGHFALGIDMVSESIRQTRERGVAALKRDVFGAVPRSGRWMTVLLADGNIGIGGDPVSLLARCRDLLVPEGRVVVEIAPPGVEASTSLATLECGDVRSKPFPWAILGVDDIAAAAASSDLLVDGVVCHGSRWSATLVKASCAQ